MAHIELTPHVTPVIDLKHGGYISGLFWQTVPEEANVNEEFSRRVDELSFTSGVFRDGDVRQIGFFTRKRDRKEKLYSLAMAVTEIVKDRFGSATFLLLGKLPGSDDVWTYIACRDDVISPMGDYAGSEEDMRTLFEEALSLGSWDTVIADPAWGEEEEVHALRLIDLVDFSRLVLDKKTLVTLYVRDPESIKRMVLLGVSGIVIAAVLYNGYQYWQNKQIEAQLERERQARLAIQLQQVVPPPWENMTDPTSFTRVCEQALIAVPTSPAGWLLKEAYCDNGTISATWSKQEYATAAMLETSIPGASLSITGDSATQTQSAAHDKGKAGDRLSARKDVSIALVSALQEMMGEYTINETPPPPLPPRADGSIPPPPDYTIYAFTYKTSLSPRTVVERIERDGLRIKKLSRSNESGIPIWLIEGVQYAK